MMGGRATSLTIDSQTFYELHPNRYLAHVRNCDLRDIAKKLKDEGAMFLFLSTVDDPIKGIIELTYIFRHISKRTLFIVKTQVSRDNPVIRSISDIFPGAQYSEVEAYDLMGVTFEGNPELRRGMFSPVDISLNGVFPLRKDSRV